MSPSEIPELIYRIGWFLPLWELEPDKIYSFLPFDVAACTRVNRLWNRTLTPLLWMAFEAYIADIEKVPKYVIQKYSHHLRYANLNSALALPIIHATRLRELEVEEMEPLAIRDLTRSNPQLEFLDINVNLEIIVVSLESIFEPLTNLTRLALRLAENTHLDQVLRPLGHLTKLRSLRLDHFIDLQAIDTFPLQLNSITELILNCKWNRNPGMHQTVRFCPSLENLEIKFVADDGPNDFLSTDLSKNLRECCPKLRSIRNAQLEEFEWSILSEDDHLRLLNSTNRLVQYDLPTTVFSSTFCDALLVHAPFLENVHIYCKDAMEETFLEATRILSSCPKLVSFRMCTRYHATLAADSLILFDHPWSCSHLQELQLYWFEPFSTKDFMQNMQGVDQSNPEPGTNNVMLSTSKWTQIPAKNSTLAPELYKSLSGQGWNMFQRGMFACSAKGLPQQELENIFHERVFERVLTMPQMRKVRLGDYFFVKRGYTI
ncbi:hypothetical protein BG003_004236 [Podila horticola]|nr:hypothetical protein BG003_004236 [Podila horticola]